MGPGGLVWTDQSEPSRTWALGSGLMSGCEGSLSNPPQDRTKAQGRKGERCSQDSQDTVTGTTG